MGLFTEEVGLGLDWLGGAVVVFFCDLDWGCTWRQLFLLFLCFILCFCITCFNNNEYNRKCDDNFTCQYPIGGRVIDHDQFYPGKGSIAATHTTL